MSDIIFCNATDSDHLPVVFCTLDPAISGEFSALGNKIKAVEQLRSLECELNSLGSEFSLEKRIKRHATVQLL
jgi:hypothetical protein